jgi:hypothetical protein
MTLKVQHIWNVKGRGKDDYPWVNRLKLRPMKDFQPDWYKKVPREIENESFFTLKMCPSTTNFMNKGFVVTNPADMFVKRISETEIQVNTDVSDNHHLLGHPKEQFGENYPFEQGFLEHSFKFESFWELDLSRSSTLLVLPCWWHHSHNLIKAYHGMIHLDKERTPTNYLINTKIRAPEIGESYKIVAETPIAHFFFIDVLDAEIGEDLPDYSNLDGRRNHELHGTARYSKGYFDYLKSYVLRRKK